jgi:hypothetical protein
LTTTILSRLFIKRIKYLQRQPECSPPLCAI